MKRWKEFICFINSNVSLWYKNANEHLQTFSSAAALKHSGIMGENNQVFINIWTETSPDDDVCALRNEIQIQKKPPTPLVKRKGKHWNTLFTANQ